MNLLQKAATVLFRLSPQSPDGWQGSAGMSDAGESVSDTSVLGLSAAWACVNLLAGTVATLPVRVYRGHGDLREPDRRHPLYRILHDSPNYDQTAVDFWEFMSASLELWGNGYARVARDRDRITGLYPIMPDRVSVRRLRDGTLEYRWTEDGTQFVESDATMLHIRGFGGNPLGGMSTLQFGRNAFGLARAVDRSAGAMFANGMRPSGTLTFENFLSDAQRDIAREKLVSQFTGAMNSGKPMILEGGATWQQLTINPEDAQMLETRGFSVEEICRFFGVPPFMVGHTEKVTSFGSGLEQQIMGFQKFTLGRRLKRIEQAVMKQLLTPKDRAAGVSVEFNLEGLLRADSTARGAFYQSALTNGWMTINEVRAKENLGPVTGGEVPRMQVQNVPITQAGNDNAD